MDISEESIKVAKEKQGGSDISYAVFDENNNPFGVSFDLVLVSCVFHHIPKESHAKTLSFLKSCMNPGALLFVFEHNPYNPVTRAVFNKHDKPTDENANMIYPPYLRKRMQQCNFDVMSINFTVFFPKLLAAFMPLEKYMASIPLGVQYYVLAKVH
jgi:SAM-dependent methyltransferase